MATRSHKPLHHFEHVRGQENRRAMANLIEQNVFHQPRAHGIDAFKRLIHQKQLGPMDQRRRHGHAFAHAFGIFGDQLVARAVQLEQFQQLIRAFLRHAAVQPVDPADEFDELAAGEMIEQQRFVRHQADLLFDFERVLRHGQTHQRDGACSGRSQAHQHFDGGGFAGAVGPQESEKAAARNRERQPIHGGLVAVDFAQIVYFNGGRRVVHAQFLS